MTTRPERRRFPRFLVDLGADVRQEGHPTRRGKLRDIGQAGVGLKPLGLSQALAPGDTIKIGLVLPEGRDARNLRLLCRVVHRVPSVLGLRFEALNPSAREDLLRYLDQLQQQIEQEQRQRREDYARSAGLRAEIRRAAVSKAGLLELVDELLDFWIETLRAESARGISDVQRREWEDEAAVLALASRETGLGHRLCAELLRPLDLQAPQYKNLVEPSLLDDQDTGLALAEEALKTSLEAGVGESWSALRPRLATVITDGAVLPFSPQTFAGAMALCLKDAGMSPTGRVLCLRQACGFLQDRLPNLYQRLLSG